MIDLPCFFLRTELEQLKKSEALLTRGFQRSRPSIHEINRLATVKRGNLAKMAPKYRKIISSHEASPSVYN